MTPRIITETPRRTSINLIINIFVIINFNFYSLKHNIEQCCRELRPVCLRQEPSTISQTFFLCRKKVRALTKRLHIVPLLLSKERVRDLSLYSLFINNIKLQTIKHNVDYITDNQILIYNIINYIIRVFLCLSYIYRKSFKPIKPTEPPTTGVNVPTYSSNENSLFAYLLKYSHRIKEQNSIPQPIDID